jgi:hypothetical protein
LIRLSAIVVCSFLFTIVVKASPASQIIMLKRAAVTVSNVRLYADSTYAKSTNITFSEGELFEVLGETVREHFDNSQNQTFKWYKVKALNGEIGWIFGDNIAVVMLERYVEYSLKPYYKKEAQFDNGFEKSLIWMAAVEGHDDKHRGTAFFNPAYKEFYIVVTNEIGKSSLLNYANVNESGKKDLQDIHFQDVTDNKIDEIIIQTNSVATGKTLDEKTLEIYSFKGGTLAKIFEERLTLTWEDDIPSPAYSKFVEIEGATIRLAYVDYISCEKYDYGVKTDERSKTQERCLEYATCSYVWDNRDRTFKPLYKESQTPVYATTSKNALLKKTPSVSAAVLTIAKPNEKLQVIKHFDEMVVEKGKKKIVNWLYVRHPSGTLGYVEASQLTFKNIEHAPILKEYYTKTPLMKVDWKPETSFVRILASQAVGSAPIVKKQ